MVFIEKDGANLAITTIHENEIQLHVSYNLNGDLLVVYYTSTDNSRLIS